MLSRPRANPSWSARAHPPAAIAAGRRVGDAVDGAGAGGAVEARASCGACGAVGTPECPVMVTLTTTRAEHGALNNQNGRQSFCRFCGFVVEAFRGETTGNDPEDRCRGSTGSTIKLIGGGVDDFASRLRHVNALLQSPVAAATLDRALELRAAAKDASTDSALVLRWIARAAEERGEPLQPKEADKLFTRHVAHSGVAAITPTRAGKRSGRRRPEPLGNRPREIPMLAAQYLERAAASCPRVAAIIAEDLKGPGKLTQFVGEYVAGAAQLGIGTRQQLRSRVAPATALALDALGMSAREIATALRGSSGTARLRRSMASASGRLTTVYEKAGLAPPFVAASPSRRLIDSLLAKYSC